MNFLEDSDTITETDLINAQNWMYIHIKKL